MLWRMAATRSLWSSAAATVTRYVLGLDHVNKRIAMLHVPTARVTYTDFPFIFPHGGVVATCPGLALVEVSAPVEPNKALVIGNPVTGRWKVLATPHLVNFPFYLTFLARNPADASVELVLYSGNRWDRYDFEADRWIRGEVPGENRHIWSLSNAWHQGSFYCLSISREYSYEEEELIAYAEAEGEKYRAALERAKAEIGDVGDVEKFETLYNPIDVNSFPESEDVKLYKSHVNQAGQLIWKQLELPSEVKRMVEGWDVNHLFEDDGKLLFYSAFRGYNTKHPLQKRRQVQRMFELDKDGKFVEDFAWYDVADELDSSCDIELQFWANSGYGNRNKEDLLRKLDYPEDWEGEDGFEDVACKDDFLNVSAGEFKAWSKEELAGERKDPVFNGDLEKRRLLFESWVDCKNDCRDVAVHREICLGGEDFISNTD